MSASTAADCIYAVYIPVSTKLLTDEHCTNVCVDYSTEHQSHIGTLIPIQLHIMSTYMLAQVHIYACMMYIYN